MKIGELFIALGFKIDGDAKLPEVERAMEKSAATAAKLALGVDALTGAFLYMVDRALDAAMALNRFGLQTGMSTDELQRWQHWAQVGGLSAEALKNTIIGIKNASSQIALGQGNASPWILLGINPHSDPFTIMRQLHLALQNATADRVNLARVIANQAGISDDVFARLRMKDDPTDSLPAQYLLTKKNKDELVALNREWENLLDLAGRTANKFSSELAPAMTEVVKFLAKGVDLLGRFVGWLDRGSPAAQATKTVLIALGGAIGALSVILTGLTGVLFTAAIGMAAFDAAAAPVLATILAIAAAVGVATAGFIKLHQLQDDMKANSGPDATPEQRARADHDATKAIGIELAGGGISNLIRGMIEQLFAGHGTPTSAPIFPALAGAGGMTVNQQNTFNVDAKDPQVAAKVIGDHLYDRQLTAASRSAPAVSR